MSKPKGTKNKTRKNKTKESPKDKDCANKNCDVLIHDTVKFGKKISKKK